MREVSEVIKQFRISVDGLEGEVVGEIRHVARSGKYPFYWWVSHYYQPSADAAGVYFPSRTTAESAEEAEALLKGYLISFTAEFGVVSA